MNRPTVAAMRRYLAEAEHAYMALLDELEPLTEEAGRAESQGWLSTEGRAAFHEAHTDLARLRASAQAIRWALGESTTPPPLHTEGATR